MQCPFCHEEVGSEDDLQIHCLVCTSAYAGSVKAYLLVFVKKTWMLLIGIAGKDATINY